MDEKTDDPLTALWRSQPLPAAPAATAEGLALRSRQLARKATRRFWGEAFSGGLSALLLLWLASAVEAPLLRLSCLLLVAGEAVVLTGLRRRSRPAPAPLEQSTSAFLSWCRGELLRERELHRTVLRWYLLPMLPGLGLLFYAGCSALGIWTAPVALVGLGSTAATLAVVVLVHRHLAHRLARELEALSAAPAR
jgi:hypothetical protein